MKREKGDFFWDGALAVRPEHPSEAVEMTLAGSKSFTNRALILAALARGETHLENPSWSDDSRTLMRLLEYFGCRFSSGTNGTVTVSSPGGEVPLKEVGEREPVILDVGPAGTVMRFLTALAAVSEGMDVVLCGSARMHQRPIGPLVDALRALGAEISYQEREGYPPLRIRGRKLSGGEVEVDGSLSSQFLSALLLVGCSLERGLRMVPKGALVSRSYLEMTCQTLQAFGVAAAGEAEGVFSVPHGAVSPTRYLIEGDASGASYLWGIAALAGRSISLRPFPKNSLQGDCGFPELLVKMGCEVARDDERHAIAVCGAAARLRGIRVDMEQMPDTAQTLAVIAAVAEGSTQITGLQTLRIKETDRIAALQAELEKVGVRTESTEDSLTVHGVLPQQLSPAKIATYDDHRMAMSFALLSEFLPSLVIEDGDVVAKSFPDFWGRLAELGYPFQRGRDLQSGG
ncbi:3-phosphoshikimate 1-carboxyvinyltransferase [bacterium]|nr:3-phosphoshikimate 1-carboxyvinyltransferase [bacterium]